MANETKHTPGPWQFSTEGKVFGGAATGLIATVTGRDDARQADARLIAAAPELLAALEAYVADHDLTAQSRNAAKFPGVGPKFSKCQCANCVPARAAIAKAKSPA